MQKRILYEFPHSHFCEKARWALDFKGLTFSRVPLLPGWHVLTTKRHGKYSSVPLLIDGTNKVQGSGNILTYLDEAYPDYPLTRADKSEAIKKEKHFDLALGVSLRAFVYYYSLKHKYFISQAFMQNSPPWQRIVFSMQYPALVHLIKRSYCPTEESAVQAGKALLGALDQVWAELDGKPYFQAEGFSRLDLTVCSLLSFVARPKELPVIWPKFPDDPLLKEWDERLRAHPLIGWIQGIYRSHRPRVLKP